ncbi:FAD-binding oxidoreductase [Marinilabilia rubra]|uniref:FAD-binding PCMH-type domain-containing protein n=1 Tax=Marinilabilia rubra TaxID=2162893 RepID=A0A2U2B9F0_9BACT|nr:FAD-binding protein [Marinilabilia rubra]PWD99695.1 hypothetical protein DDZ16_09630 [Marinilabilia rubra]
MHEPLNTAKNCRHYAMCKIDFLGSGVCASGPEKHYVSFYPQGRMDLYAALAEGKVPVTEKCLEIADTCDLCGKCDYQCYFVTELRPTKAMEALKDYVADHLEKSGEVVKEEVDEVLKELKKIVGDFWATSDRAIAVTYSHDPSPVAEPTMPDYVIMPETREEVSAIVKLLNLHDIPFAVRGNGSSVMGFVMSSGAVLDMNRMKTIEFDEKNWLVKTGAGVTAFDLQKSAQERGYRVNAAEPSALVCANIMCSGIFSLFSASYGTAADNYIDAEFVSKDGTPFKLSDKDAPNLFAFNPSDGTIPAICTSASIRLHPVTGDEEGILIPFATMDEALDFSKECATHRIGMAIGVLGGEYLSTFMAPTKKLAWEIKNTFQKELGIEYLVLVIGGKYDIKTIQNMELPTIDQELFKALYLGMPSLRSANWLSLLKEMSDDEPFSYLKLNGFTDLSETALSPSPEQLAKEVDPELQSFFKKLFDKPEMTDLVWLNMFRIISSRMGREKHVVALIIYLPIDNALIAEIDGEFRRIAEKHQIKNDYGFITPLDNGKRCVFEYDYYLDQNDPDEIAHMQQALGEAAMMIEGYVKKTGTVKSIFQLFTQGFCRKENFLYS